MSSGPPKRRDLLSTGVPKVAKRRSPPMAGSLSRESPSAGAPWTQEPFKRAVCDSDAHDTDGRVGCSPICKSVVLGACGGEGDLRGQGFSWRSARDPPSYPRGPDMPVHGRVSCAHSSAKPQQVHEQLTQSVAYMYTATGATLGGTPPQPALHGKHVWCPQHMVRQGAILHIPPDLI